MNTELVKALLSVIIQESEAKEERSSLIGQSVIVRARNAGVHYGTLEEQGRDYVRLSDARRIWNWEGAFTLSEVSQVGPSSARVAVSVPTLVIPVLDIGEILLMTKKAKEVLDAAGAD